MIDSISQGMTSIIPTARDVDSALRLFLPEPIRLMNQLDRFAVACAGFSCFNDNGVKPLDVVH
ncbi:hypothetical protein [Synechococcus sp. CC9616]|uniref:hypothetical protein n=1 Tax=Synechococcus sp. CC9616 TaxID=110663 RepID=UPI00048E4F19|nr:hypothetical protein [Synechococcus sp. CC9616]